MADSKGSPQVSGWYHSGSPVNGYFDEINQGGPVRAQGSYRQTFEVSEYQHTVSFELLWENLYHGGDGVHVKIDVSCGTFLDFHVDVTYTADYFSSFPAFSFVIDAPFSGDLVITYDLNCLDSSFDYYTSITLHDVTWGQGEALPPSSDCECCCSCC